MHFGGAGRPPEGDAHTTSGCAARFELATEKGPLESRPRTASERGDLLFRRLPGVDRVLNPGERHQEEGCQEKPEQGVHPEQGRIEGAQSETGDQDAQGPAKRVFHDGRGVETVRGTARLLIS